MKDILYKIFDKMQVLDSLSTRIDGIDKIVQAMSKDLHDMDRKFDEATERLVRLERDVHYLDVSQKELKAKHDVDVDILHNKFRDWEPKVEKQIDEKINTNSVITGQRNKIWVMGGALSFISALIGAVVSAIFR